MSVLDEYPIMKKPVSSGKILNFRNGERKYRVKSNDGICAGEKGFLMKVECIHSNNEAMVGEIYHFDDRIFRSYNENNIVIEDGIGE